MPGVRCIANAYFAYKIRFCVCISAQSVSLYYGTVPHSLPCMLGMEVRKARRSLAWKMGDFYLDRAYPCSALRNIEKHISHIIKKRVTRLVFLLSSQAVRKERPQNIALLYQNYILNVLIKYRRSACSQIRHRRDSPPSA